MTLPMSFIVSAPVDAIASSIRASTSASDICSGMNSFRIATSLISISASSLRPAFSNCSILSLRCLSIFSITATTCWSSSSIRLSTSICLMAAVSRRKVPRRSLSLLRMAVLTSSLIRVLRAESVMKAKYHHLKNEVI